MSRAAPSAEICVLQHAEDTPPGLFGDWLELRGLAHLLRRPDLGERVPANPTHWQGIVILGSEHSVTATEPSWIRDELELTRRAIAAGVPVLGICFGGQMVARAMGAAITSGATPSIGWRDVASSGSGPGVDGPWLHYNYETFTLPKGAVQIATYGAVPAAFRAGPHLAVQFHPEATVEIVRDWARSDAERLSRLGLDPSRLIDASPRRCRAARERALGLFDAWLSGW